MLVLGFFLFVAVVVAVGRTTGDVDFDVGVGGAATFAVSGGAAVAEACGLGSSVSNCKGSTSGPGVAALELVVGDALTGSSVAGGGDVERS